MFPTSLDSNSGANYYSFSCFHIVFRFAGMVPGLVANNMVTLTPSLVSHIHEQGGSILGSSRGNQDIGTMVDYLVSLKVGILFCIGGDGTFRGAARIASGLFKLSLPPK